MLFYRWSWHLLSIFIDYTFTYFWKLQEWVCALILQEIEVEGVLLSLAVHTRSGCLFLIYNIYAFTTILLNFTTFYPLFLKTSKLRINCRLSWSEFTKGMFSSWLSFLFNSTSRGNNQVNRTVDRGDQQWGIWYVLVSEELLRNYLLLLEINYFNIHPFHQQETVRPKSDVVRARVPGQPHHGHGFPQVLFRKWWGLISVTISRFGWSHKLC